MRITNLFFIAAMLPLSACAGIQTSEEWDRNHPQYQPQFAKFVPSTARQLTGPSDEAIEAKCAESLARQNKGAVRLHIAATDTEEYMNLCRSALWPIQVFVGDNGINFVKLKGKLENMAAAKNSNPLRMASSQQ